MLYAALEQIEKRHPDATVLFNDKSPGIRHHNVKTNLRFIKPPRLMFGHYPWAILSKLNLPYLHFTEFYPDKNIDLILDANGFRLGDHLNKSEEYYQNMDYYYETLKTQGASIILLSQAFGPFETELAKKGAKIINKYADLIIARETVSKKYLIDAGVDPHKIRQYPDFTIATTGVFPDKFQSLKGGVCIIPNTRMIKDTHLSSQEYYASLESIISRIRKTDKKIFLLNHEGKEDMEICKKINRNYDNRFTVVTGLNAKEIKGLIGSCYMVISSRYHGAVSSLSQGIPCLATSWSHKYQLLFEDFNLKNHIIDPDEKIEQTEKKIDFMLDSDNHTTMKKHLLAHAQKISQKTENMWEEIWQIVR